MYMLDGKNASAFLSVVCMLLWIQLKYQFTPPFQLNIQSHRSNKKNIRSHYMYFHIHTLYIRKTIEINSSKNISLSLYIFNRNLYITPVGMQFNEFSYDTSTQYIWNASFSADSLFLCYVNHMENSSKPN